MSIVLNDSFSRANANPIGGIYSTVSGQSALKIVSDVVEGSTSGVDCVSADTSNSYIPDQYCQITVGTVSGGGIEFYCYVRMTSPTGTWSAARSDVSAGSTTAHLNIYIAETPTLVATITLNTNPANGDTYQLSVTGQLYTMSQNGSIVGTYTDSSNRLTGGTIAMGIGAPSTLGNATLSNLQSGNNTNILSVSAFSAAAVSSLATTVGITTTTGMAGIAFVQSLSAHPLSTFTDTAGNTWNVPGSPTLNVTLGGVHFYAYMCWAQNITGGTNQIYTAGLSAPGALTFNVQFFTGRVTSGTLFDGGVGTFSDSSAMTSHPGPSVITSFRNSDLAMMAWDVNMAAEAYTAGSGFGLSTVNTNPSGAGYFPSMAQYQLLVPAGTYNGAYTTANATIGGGIIVALLNATTGGSSSGLTLMGMG